MSLPTIPSSVSLLAGGSSASNKLAESIGVNLYNTAISIIHESEKDEGDKDNSDDDSILLSSLSSGEDNTFEKLDTSAVIYPTIQVEWRHD